MGENDEKKEVRSQPKIFIPVDTQILYSDMAYITSTQSGIVIDFVQTDSLHNRLTVISRIGVSNDHAESLLKTITVKLLESKLKKSKKSKSKYKKH